MAELDEHYFSALVPWLLLTAALLFLAQPAVTRLAGIGKDHTPPTPWTVASVVVFQFLVAVYGGYFGAGIGILMLSALGLMGFGNIHRMNALKTILAGAINGMSVLVFVFEQKVQWSMALPMMLGAIAGGYLAAHVGRRLPHVVVRWFVIAVGLVLSAYYFAKQMGVA